MTATWGAWDSGNRVRCGVELIQSPSSVGYGTTSVTITANIYIQVRYAGYESGGSTTPWAIGGTWSDSGYGNGFNLGAMGIKLVGSSTHVETTSFTSTIPVTVNGNVTSTYAYPGETGYSSQSLTVPARPIGGPAAPSACSSTRVSDTQQTVTWTNGSSTTGNPISNMCVERAMNDGTFAQVAVIGFASSWTDNGTVANSKYQYRVRSRNSAGYSGYSTSGVFATTPAAPSACAAAKNSGGDIIVTWVDNSAYNSGVKVWHAANGVWDGSPLATLGNVTTYTHSAPTTATTHTYRVQATTTSPALTSAYSAASNVVQLLSAPNAPTLLSPVSSTVVGDNPITFTWRHNANDSSVQTKFNLQTRVQGSPTWVSTSGTVTSSVSSYTMAAGAYADGQNIQWQVQTWGAYSTAGPFSATGLVLLASMPVVVINTPADGGSVGTSTLSATWGYSNSDSSPQAVWQATLYDATSHALESQSAADPAATAVAFTTHLANGTAYKVGVKVQAATGIWSAEDVNSFTVSYNTPSTPVLTASYDAPSGSVAVAVQVDGPSTRTNLCTNGNFETDASGWSATTHISTPSQAADPTTIYGGDVMVVSVASAAPPDAYVYAAVAAFPAGSPMNLSASVKPDPASNPHTFHLEIAWKNSGGTVISTAVGSDLVIQNGSWGRLNMNATAPALTTNCEIRVANSDGLALGDIWYVDGVLAENASQQLVYIDGTKTSVNAVSVTVLRSINGGPYVPIVTGLNPNTTFTDSIPALNATNAYSAVAISATPSSAASVQDAVVVTSPAQAAFVNSGQGFGAYVSFSEGVDVQAQPGLAKALHAFAGRTKPVETSGEQTSLSFALAAIIYSPIVASTRSALTSSWDEVAALAQLPGPACLRTPTGLRFFVSTAVPQITLTESKMVGAVSWPMTQTDFTEGAS